MPKGFVDMDLPQSQITGGPSARLEAGFAVGLSSVLPLRVGWRALASGSDLPSAQFEWAVATANQLGAKLRANVAYISDGSSLRAILPLLMKPRAGIEHFEYLAPTMPMPIDILHTDRAALDLLLSSVMKLGRPIHLSGMLAESPATDALRQMVDEKRRRIHIESAEPANYLSTAGFPLQDRGQNAARVSIIATSYGLSGGPSDVIFQFIAPSLDQVMQLCNESLQLQSASQIPAKNRPKQDKEVDDLGFLRTHAFDCAQRGEIRFSCLRLAGRLLAVQMLQVRKGTAWLLSSGTLERFRDTTLGALLMSETVRKLQQESVQRIMVPSAASVKDVGECQQLACVNVAMYPWSSRSLMAATIERAGRMFVKASAASRR